MYVSIRRYKLQPPQLFQLGDVTLLLHMYVANLINKPNILAGRVLRYSRADVGRRPLRCWCLFLQVGWPGALRPRYLAHVRRCGSYRTLLRHLAPPLLGTAACAWRLVCDTAMVGLRLVFPGNVYVHLVVRLLVSFAVIFSVP